MEIAQLGPLTKAEESPGLAQGQEGVGSSGDSLTLFQASLGLQGFKLPQHSNP